MIRRTHANVPADNGLLAHSEFGLGAPPSAIPDRSLGTDNSRSTLPVVDGNLFAAFSNTRLTGTHTLLEPSRKPQPLALGENCCVPVKCPTGCAQPLCLRLILDFANEKPARRAKLLADASRLSEELDGGDSLEVIWVCSHPEELNHFEKTLLLGKSEFETPKLGCDRKFSSRVDLALQKAVSFVDPKRITVIVALTDGKPSGESDYAESRIESVVFEVHHSRHVATLIVGNVLPDHLPTWTDRLRLIKDRGVVTGPCDTRETSVLHLAKARAGFPFREAVRTLEQLGI